MRTMICAALFAAVSAGAAPMLVKDLKLTGDANGNGYSFTNAANIQALEGALSARSNDWNTVTSKVTAAEASLLSVNHATNADSAAAAAYAESANMAGHADTATSSTGADYATLPSPGSEAGWITQLGIGSLGLLNLLPGSSVTSAVALATNALSVPLSGVSGAGTAAASSSNAFASAMPFVVLYSNGTSQGFSAWYSALSNMQDCACLIVRGSHDIAQDPLPSNDAGVMGARTGCSIVGVGGPTLTATIISNVSGTAGNGFNFTFCTNLYVSGINWRTVVDTNYTDAAGNAYGWKMVGRGLEIERCKFQFEVNSLNCTNAKTLVISDPTRGHIRDCDVVSINNCASPVEVRVVADHDDTIGLDWEGCRFVDLGVTNFCVINAGTYMRFSGCAANTNTPGRVALGPMSWTAGRACFVGESWTTYSNRYPTAIADWPQDGRLVAFPLQAIDRASSGGLTTFTTTTTNRMGFCVSAPAAIYWPVSGQVVRVTMRVGGGGETGTNQVLRFRYYADDLGTWITNSMDLNTWTPTAGTGTPPIRHFNSPTNTLNRNALWYIDLLNNETQTVYYSGGSVLVRVLE